MQITNAQCKYPTKYHNGLKRLLLAKIAKTPKKPVKPVKLTPQQRAFNQRHKNLTAAILIAATSYYAKNQRFKLTVRQLAYNTRHKNLTAGSYKKLQHWYGNRHIMHHYLGLRTFSSYPNG
jgi:hypothetical protein